jgi:hypothetical protein
MVDLAVVISLFQKLLETNVLVKDMRIQLKDLEPILVQKSQAVENLMLKLAEDQASADLVRNNVTIEEAAAKVSICQTFWSFVQLLDIQMGYIFCPS